MKKSRFLLIDSNALVHRAFHALPPLRTKEGLNIGAVYGFTSTLLKAIEDIKPDYIAATFDLAAPTFRHEEYKEYKATRVKAPDELYEQIPYTKEVLTALNIPVFELAGYEADDLIGTLCKRIDDKKLNIDTYIVTGDMDTLQLVDDNTRVYTLRKGIKDTIIYDTDLVEQKYGFGPSQVIDYKALRGDPSDNIPGVKGIGEKTATDLIKKYGSLGGVYEAINDNVFSFSNSVKDKLITDKENAYLSKKLATIELNVPIEIEIEKCCTYDFDKVKATEIFQKLEFRSLMGRLLKLVDGKNKNDGIVGAGSLRQKQGAEIASLQDSVDYTLINTKESFDKFINDLKKQKEFAFDTETTSLNAMESELVGISFSWKSREAYYIPVGHAVPLNDTRGKQLDKEFVLEKLRPIFSDEKIKKIGHNLKYDLLVMKKSGVEVEGVYFDTMIAAYLINPTRTHNNLESLILEYLNLKKDTYTETLKKSNKGKENTLLDIDIDKLVKYACGDADAALRLYEKLKPILEKEKLEKVFYDIEIPLIRVLAKIEKNGVKIDRNLMEQMSREVQKELEKLEDSIFEMAGEKFNIQSSIQLAKILFEKLGLEPVKFTEKGKPSTDEEVLATLAVEHDLPREILKFRTFAKLKNTYLDSLPELINPKTNRVHTSFNQTVTATGRLSSSEPNLQNIPIRDEIGRKVRMGFVPEDGNILISADYSQIELRVLAHFSQDEALVEAFKSGKDIHRHTASIIFKCSEEEVTEEMRRRAKSVNFGIIYGLQAFGLSKQLGIPVNEAKSFIESYFESFPKVKNFVKEVIEEVKESGEVRTLYGRRRVFPDLYKKSIQDNLYLSASQRMALNTKIQGTAADIIKIAMIELDKKLPENAKIILQIHDELLIECPENIFEEVKKIVKVVMENCCNLNVPLTVDIGYGKNWSEAH
uniref:DNA polymerase I n=1 Tax=candidate division CPR3 bacterium TaxID=2268181 RepID=A0A7C4M1N1_UNCC3